jgi:hypothetical protein
MKELKDFLGNIHKLLFKEESKKKLLQEIFFNLLNIKIETENMEIKNNIVFLKIKPIYKNEIFLQKEKLLLSIKKDLNSNITDIR